MTTSEQQSPVGDTVAVATAQDKYPGYDDSKRRTHTNSGSTESGDGGSTHSGSADGSYEDSRKEQSATKDGSEGRVDGSEDQDISDDDACSGKDEGGDASYRSLQRDGPVPTKGGVDHPDGCRPCAFYCFSFRGCRAGQDCTFCHQVHHSKLRERREEWKKAQRDKRRRAPGRPQNATGVPPAVGDARAPKAPEAPPSPHARQQQMARMVQPPEQQMTHLMKVMLQQVQAQMEQPLVQAQMKQAQMSQAAMAQMKQAQMSQAAMAQMQAQMRQAQVQAQMAQMVQAQMHQAALPMEQPQMRAFPPKSRSQGGQPKGRGANARAGKAPAAAPAGLDDVPWVVHTSMSRPAASGTAQLGMWAQPGSAAQQGGGGRGKSKVDLFTYSPKSCVLEIGQQVELWPPAHVMGTGLCFKATPMLPPGFKIEEETGIIHGTAQMPTEGLASFFVTGEEPLTGAVQSAASVQLKVNGYPQLGEQRLGQNADDCVPWPQ